MVQLLEQSHVFRTTIEQDIGGVAVCFHGSLSDGVKSVDHFRFALAHDVEQETVEVFSLGFD